MAEPSDAAPLSRRELLKGAALGAAAVRGIGVACPQAQGGEGHYPVSDTRLAEFDFAGQSAALRPDEIVDSACQFCNSLCRLKVHLKGGRIIDVRGEPDDPVQADGLCV